MLPTLIIIFVLTPVIELFLLIELGRMIGTWNVIVIVVVTGVAGAMLAKSQGLSVLRDIQVDLANGILPADRLFDGALVLVGGVLLITPGNNHGFAGFPSAHPADQVWGEKSAEETAHAKAQVWRGANAQI